MEFPFDKLVVNSNEIVNHPVQLYDYAENEIFFPENPVSNTISN